MKLHLIALVLAVLLSACSRQPSPSQQGVPGPAASAPDDALVELRAELKLLTDRVSSLETVVSQQKSALAQLQPLAGQLAEVDSTHASAEAQLTAQLLAVQLVAGGAVDAASAVQARVLTLEGQRLDGRLSTVESVSSTLEARAAALETKTAAISVRTVHDQPAVLFTGVNVVIQNGTGHTAQANGVGNLVVGYDELRQTALTPKTGSHNVVLGDDNSYTATGSFVSGFNNSVTGPDASVIGGTRNAVYGSYTAIVGGSGNQAHGFSAVVLGGEDGAAEGDYTVSLGGSLNRAMAEWSVAAGGRGNWARANLSSVFGGESNWAGEPTDVTTGQGSAIFGGYSNRTRAVRSAVVGGDGSAAATASSTLIGTHSRTSSLAGGFIGGRAAEN